MTGPLIFGEQLLCGLCDGTGQVRRPKGTHEETRERERQARMARARNLPPPPKLPAMVVCPACAGSGVLSRRDVPASPPPSWLAGD